MKYPKVLQILALTTAITMAAPCVAIPARASETTLTPQEYEEQYDYVLPEGYHYVLNDDQYVILDENDVPVIEADVPAEPEAPEEAEASAEAETPAESETPAEAEPLETSVNPEASAEIEPSETSEGSASPEVSEEPEKPEISGESEESEKPEASVKPETPAEPVKPETSVKPEAPAEPVKSEVSAKPETPVDLEKPDNTGNITDSAENDKTAQDDDKDASDSNSGEESGLEETGSTGNMDDHGNAGEQNAVEQPEATESPEASDESVADEQQESVVELEGRQEMSEAESEPFYLTSAEFRAIHDRIQYNVEVPIEGLPSFITQEMVVGALKAQDETGYPASVTIAQIIQESGYGKYGPGGDEGKGLSYLAFEYCNLFGIKGTGTAGSVTMKTSEMESDGSTYSIRAGFRVYHTYTECIEDRSKILKEVYSDLTENVTDANTFAMRIGKRWATSINYGKHLINTMKRYDLYRLDDMTLNEFSEMIGEFANPCPGSTITSLFGRRSAPIAGASTYHKGLDMGTGVYNIPTYAAKAGTVIFAGEAGACGNLITIDHGDGLVTKYMHHAEIYVEKGDKVEQGQQIGLSGTTGNSTGNHLHFQVEENGRAVDPLKYLQASAEGSEAAKKAFANKQAKAVKDAKEAKLQLVKALMREKLNY